jgi:ribonuclease P protein component
MPAAPVERLRRRADFVAAAKGARLNGPLFTLQARARAEGGDARLGFTVTKKVGVAVERNRIRRRLREAARQAFAGTAPLGAVDYVIVARRGVLDADFISLVDELSTALRRAPAKLKPRAPAPGNGNG